jgi:hypothetical protein
VAFRRRYLNNEALHAKRRRDRIDYLLLTSEAAGRILQNLTLIQDELASRKRKVWPVAQVAQLFRVSERLVWNWIASGVLPKYQPPSKSYRPGITARAIRAFLSVLEECGECGVELMRERKEPAWERGKEEFGKLRADEKLTPAQMAARARISITTVYRLAADHAIESDRPTPHRIRIRRRRRKY